MLLVISLNAPSYPNDVKLSYWKPYSLSLARSHVPEVTLFPRPDFADENDVLGSYVRSNNIYNQQAPVYVREDNKRFIFRGPDGLWNVADYESVAKAMAAGTAVSSAISAATVYETSFKPGDIAIEETLYEHLFLSLRRSYEADVALITKTTKTDPNEC